MNTFIERIEKLRTSIAEACEMNGRNPKHVELLPVSKHQQLTTIQEAATLGFTKFGENYVQEAVQKFNGAQNLEFVLIGPLQNNKSKQALITFQEIMTIDRLTQVERLGKIAEQLNITRAVWIQVNPWGESTKSCGCSIPEIEILLQALTKNPHLPIKGFMAIPPPMNIQAFHTMASLRHDWQQRLGKRLLLSMGMSADFSEAIKYGSDQIRVGTAFFGTRP